MPFTTLNECPAGIFRTEDGNYGFKSEYATKGKCDAYCLDTGEYFTGGATDAEERGLQMVEPVDFVGDLSKLRQENQALTANLAEANAAHDRTRDRLRDSESAKRDAENQRKFFESRAENAERSLQTAQGAAMELRGRLLEARGNQMVRRGDVAAARGLPDPYDDGVPF